MNERDDHVNNPTQFIAHRHNSENEDEDVQE
jgi:hypothetical protein